MSKSTLRRMEGDELAPVIGPKNVHLFQEEQVQALVVTRRSTSSDVKADGELAAEVFELFDGAVHPVDVVKQLRVAPEVIESLHKQWARLRGFIVLSHETTAAITNILCDSEADRTSTPGTEGDLLRLATKWVQEFSLRHCVQCKTDSAEFCRACAKSWGLRAARNELAQRKAERL